MSRISRWGLLLLAAIPLLASCTPSVSSDIPNQRRMIILTNGDDPFWDTMRKGMEIGAEELKLDEAGLTVSLEKGDFSDKTQIDKLKQYATQSNVVAVAISPTNANSSGIADAMRELRKKGVIVIAIDSDMQLPKYRDTRVAYLGTDNFVGGQELGKTIKGLRPAGGEFATFVGKKSVANAQQRIGGTADGAGEKFVEVDSLDDDSDKIRAQQNVKTVLENHSKVNTLVGIWAYNAHAIVQVVKERKLREQTTIVVFDAAKLALDDMEKGDIDAMVVQNPFEMGRLGTKLMKAFVENDSQAIQEMYPDYDPETKKFKSENGDIYHTELRVVVPDESSPLKSEMFNEDTKFFYYQEFKAWLKERGLTSS